ncbi:MAG: CocE/NonD family hydrolase [Actinomycetes bacterium]
MYGELIMRGIRQSAALIAVLAAAAVLASACAGSPPPRPLPPRPGQGPAIGERTYLVRAGIEQVYVTDATVGGTVSLTGPGTPTQSKVADTFGSVVFRGLTQGSTVTVTDESTAASQTVRVLDVDEPPSDAFYRAPLMQAGLNYIPMRDGTLLAIVVRPPVGLSVSDGPFPTLIEYSGYAVSGPQDPLADKVARLLDPSLPGDPLTPGGETFVGGVLARLAGYATVSVQLRGTGCSGGESDLFDLPSSYDGYDVVETLARQPWVLNGRPGMIGISFSGFSQIATAATRPPHLAAIVPLSFLGRVWDVGRPGGIFNTGFAETWLADRVATARPAPSDGAMDYANTLVATDANCKENQRLRLQTRDGDGIFRNTVLNLEDYQRRDLEQRLDQIDVPVFGSLQFQDEQTSAYAMLNLNKLTERNPRAWMTLSSGEHNDSLSPDTIVDLFQFLDLYVARRTPDLKVGLYLTTSIIFGSGGAGLPFPSLAGLRFGDALRRWELRPQYSFGVERDKGSGNGASGTRWKFTSSSFPPAGATTSTWYLSADGALAPTAPSVGTDGSAAYVSDPSRRPASSSSGWTQVPSNNGLGFVSPPMAADAVVAGPIGADLWVSSTASNTDLQVTVTEVRPDGKELFVTNGVQRASFREVTGTDPIKPNIDFTSSSPLQPGANRVRVQVLPVVHAFRTGSRIRIVVAPVGGDRRVWRYDSVDDGVAPTNSLFFGSSTPSSISLPLATGVEPPSPIGSCPSFGQPCRSYQPLANGG